jgi:hypothetical protein
LYFQTPCNKFFLNKIGEVNKMTPTKGAIPLRNMAAGIRRVYMAALALFPTQGGAGGLGKRPGR